jgi:hypothetical protein
LNNLKKDVKIAGKVIKTAKIELEKELGKDIVTNNRFI